MTSYKSPAKKIRSVNRLINFIKKKCLEEKHQNLSITVLPSTSLTPNLSPKPNQNLAISKTTMIDVPPDISLSIYVCSPHLSLGENLPQLDGCTPDIPSSFQCPDCRTIFETQDELKHHDETHQFGWLVDLHELEKHPDSTYALNYIPYLTKLQFARTFQWNYICTYFSYIFAKTVWKTT